MAKEGWKIVVCFAVPGLAGVVIGCSQSSALVTIFGVLAGCLALFSAYFIRDPIRTPPQERNAIISPADGRIIRIAEDNDGVAKTIRISIFMSVWDVHVNRAPISGRIVAVRYFPGKFHAAWRDKASLDNEQVHVDIESQQQGSLIRLRLIAGLVARRVVCRVKPGDKVRAGERIGIIKFGSRAEVFLPSGANLTAKLGDKVKAGESVLALLPESVHEKVN